MKVKWWMIYLLVFVVILLARIACNQPAEHLKSFISPAAVLKYAFANQHMGVNVDTIALESNHDRFEHNGDTIILQNLSAPLFPQYSDTGLNPSQPLVDTPQVWFNRRQWILPLGLSKQRLAMAALLYITTVNKKYLALILNDPAAQGEAVLYNTVCLLDFSQESAPVFLYSIRNSAENFIDYNHDGELEMLRINKGKTVIKQKSFSQYYTVDYVRPTTEINKPEVLLGDSLPPMVTYLDSPGKYYLVSPAD